MNSPAIVVVDSDSAALDTLERALRSRYTSDYTIACLGSAEEAVATLERMESEGAPAALVLVAHGARSARPVVSCSSVPGSSTRTPSAPSWCRGPPPATGRPPSAIYDSMALGRMDYYALKPATPSDELFHAVYLQLPARVEQGDRHNSSPTRST